jgi:cysteine synthase A
MTAIFEDITAAVGFTPLVRINKLAPPDTNVLAKLEFYNPCHSVKDRIGLAMINDALENGKINQDTELIEPTSGNTGIALAFVCAAKGLKLTLTMPESMSLERRKILQLFGAKIILTPAEKGMTGAVETAEKLLEKNPNAYMLQQFKNPANPNIHRETTAREIWNDTDGNVDIVVAGVGTGGTITGCGEFLKSKNPDLKVVAVEPEDSPVLSGGKSGPHKIQGIGAGFVPDILNHDIIDEILTVSNQDAIRTARDLAQKEGIFTGISAGANVFAAIRVARRPENKSKTVVTFACDTGERYLSTELFENLPEPIPARDV